MRAFEYFYKTATRYAMTIENVTYDVARNLSNGQYDGGNWLGLTDIVNYPAEPQTLSVGFVGNYVEPLSMSNKAFGVYVGLVVYNRLCWANYANAPTTESDYYGELFHKLRRWLLDEGTKHGITEEEVNHIMRMID